ncbi:MAG: TTC39/IML2 family protein [Verrucomicrobia subdivision 3 bacterium]|nr:TTC39/IML2 family protein [Limisphaerales bacterium]
MVQTANLEAPDRHHLLAAEGWLELGNPAEAAEEIARIRPELLEHADVLEIRWAICAAERRWETGLPLAELLVRVAPDRASAWLHRAYTLRRVKGGGLESAWEALRPAFEKFPKSEIVPFNLACYAAQMGRLDEAWEWLHKAMESAGDVAAIKRIARADPDLEPLWERISTL